MVGCGKTSWAAYTSSCCRGWGGGVQEGVPFPPRIRLQDTTRRHMAGSGRMQHTV